MTDTRPPDGADGAPSAPPRPATGPSLPARPRRRRRRRISPPGSTTILLTDDDPDLRFTLGAQLEADGYRVLAAAGGQEALALAERELPHLALLDVLMPGMDGFALARRLKALGDVPIVLLTALDDEESKVRGLEQCAEDYVTKPFSYRELHARLKRVLARAWSAGLGRAGLLTLPGPGSAVEGAVQIDFARRQVLRAGVELARLSPTEARLLRLLVGNAGRVLPAALLLDRAWPEGGGSVPALWEYVRRLRHKLGDDPDHPHYIQSQRGVGYRFHAPGHRPAERAQAG